MSILLCLYFYGRDEYSGWRLTTYLLPVPKPDFIPILVKVPWVCFTPSWMCPPLLSLFSHVFISQIPVVCVRVCENSEWLLKNTPSQEKTWCLCHLYIPTHHSSSVFHPWHLCLRDWKFFSVVLQCDKLLVSYLFGLKHDCARVCVTVCSGVKLCYGLLELALGLSLVIFSVVTFLIGQSDGAEKICKFEYIHCVSALEMLNLTQRTLPTASLFLTISLRKNLVGVFSIEKLLILFLLSSFSPLYLCIGSSLPPPVRVFFFCHVRTCK